MEADRTKSETIRRLSAEGKSVAEIARTLGIRYQFAYNVLNRSPKPVAAKRTSIANVVNAAKPWLTLELLVQGGFEYAASWRMAEDARLQLSAPMPALKGVYAFVMDGSARYVGVTQRTLAQRMSQYAYGHVSQPTNLVMRARLIGELEAGRAIDVYSVVPGDLNWRAWSIDVAAGLETSIIRGYHLPWNKKGIEALEP